MGAHQECGLPETEQPWKKMLKQKRCDTERLHALPPVYTGYTLNLRTLHLGYCDCDKFENHVKDNVSRENPADMDV